MTKPRPYQIRVFLKEEFAKAAASGTTLPAMKPLMETLARHQAALDHNQLEEFTSFMKTVEEHPEIPKGAAQRLYDLTKNSLANPEKRSYFAREFTIRVNKKVVFKGHEADQLIADLQKLDGSILTRGKAFRPGKIRNAAAVRKVYIPKRHPGT